MAGDFTTVCQFIEWADSHRTEPVYSYKDDEVFELENDEFTKVTAHYDSNGNRTYKVIFGTHYIEIDKIYLDPNDAVHDIGWS